MADVITNDDLDNDNKPGQSKVQQAGQAVDAPAAGSGAPNNAPQQGYKQATGQPQQQSTVTSYNPNQQKGSGYTNIQRVLQANQGNRLGQTIGAGVQQAGQRANEAISQGQQDFNAQTQQNATGTQDQQQFVQNALNNPSNITNPNDVSKFQQLISGQYNGPMNLSNQDKIQSQVNDVNQLGKAIGSAGGQQSLLQRFVGNPNYTQGQQGLDVALLGQSGGQDLAAARRQALMLQNQAGGAIGGAQAIGQKQAALANQFGQDVQGQLGTAATTAEQALAKKATEAQNQRNATIAQIQADLASGKISQEEADQLGVGNGQRTYGIDVNQFLQANPLAASEANVASADDYARFQALQKLAGTNAPTAAQDVFQKFADPTQAGQFNANPAYTFNKEGFQKALNSTQDQFNASAKPTADRLDQAQRIAAIWNADNGMTVAQRQQAIAQFAPGALGGNSAEDQKQWAMNNLRSAQDAHVNKMHELNAQYGGEGQFFIQPKQPQVQAPPDMGLEKMPTVK